MQSIVQTKMKVTRTVMRRMLWQMKARRRNFRRKVTAIVVMSSGKGKKAMLSSRQPHYRLRATLKKPYNPLKQYRLRLAAVAVAAAVRVRRKKAQLS
jgi:hypothetical protein